MGFEKRDTATQDMHEAFCIKAYGYYWKIAIVNNLVYIKSVKLYGIYHHDIIDINDINWAMI